MAPGLRHSHCQLPPRLPSAREPCAVHHPLPPCAGAPATRCRACTCTKWCIMPFCHPRQPLLLCPPTPPAKRTAQHCLCSILFGHMCTYAHTHTHTRIHAPHMDTCACTTHAQHAHARVHAVPLQALSRSGCHRTALECCKLLLALEPQDPLGATCLIDYLALRAGACRSWQRPGPWWMLHTCVEVPWVRQRLMCLKLLLALHTLTCACFPPLAALRRELRVPA